MLSHMTPNAMLLPPLPPLPSLSSVSLLASAPGEVPTHEPVAEGQLEVHASPLHRLCAAFALPTLPPTFRCSFVHAQPQMTLAGRGQQAVAPTCRGNGASEEVILETEQCHMKAILYGGAKSVGFLQAFTAALKEHGDNHRAVRETVHEKFRQPSGGKIVDGVASGCGVGRGWQTNMGQQRQRRR